jgi:hypothetical protein
MTVSALLRFGTHAHRAQAQMFMRVMSKWAKGVGRSIV